MDVKSIAGLIKRLLGFYQTPCTILDGVQYSWPIPLDVCSVDNEPISKLACLNACHPSVVSLWLAAIDYPLHSNTTLTLAEFEHEYATKSNLTVPQLHALGGHAAPCTCGEYNCKGWQMVTQ